MKVIRDLRSEFPILSNWNSESESDLFQQFNLRTPREVYRKSRSQSNWEFA